MATMPYLSEEEIQAFRELFPVTRKWIYLNHAGVAPISLPVAEAVETFNRQALAEGYTRAATWHKRIGEIRAASAALIGAQSSEIAFVKNTSHGLSLIARGLHLREGDEVLISALEFPSNVYPWMALQKQGVVLKKIPAQHGALDLGRLESLVTDRTRLISLSSVAFGTGYRLPLADIGKLCRDLGIMFMVDVIQSLGAFPIDVEAEHIDFLAADAHKWMLGHEGIGLLYVRQKHLERLEPALLGWNSVANPLNFDQIDFHLKNSAERFEEGSLNGLSLYGLGAAIDLLQKVGVEKISARILRLTEILIDGLQSMDCPIRSPLRPEQRSGIVSFGLPGHPDAGKLAALERRLFENGIYGALRSGGLRFSPHFYNSEAEIKAALAAVEKGLSI